MRQSQTLSPNSACTGAALLIPDGSLSLRRPGDAGVRCLNPRGSYINRKSCRMDTEANNDKDC